jgi:predicted dehydrogenase
MRISIIGTGFIADLHAQAISALGHELVAVVNQNIEKATLFAKKWQVPTYGTDVQLALQNVDCVHICSPPNTHYPIVLSCLEANKHIICEKPLTLDLQQATHLYQIAEKKQLVAAVNYNVRFHQTCHQAKELIAQPDFGKILLIHGSYLQEFHALPDYYNWRYQNQGDFALRASTEIGSHWIDLARYWTQLEIEAVSANFANFHPFRKVNETGMMEASPSKSQADIEVKSEDVAIMSFKFSNGSIGNVLLSEVSHGRKNQLQIEVTGSQQSIWWNNEDPYKLHIGKKMEAVQTHINPFGGGFSNTFKALFEAVYHAIESKSSDQCSYPTFYDGYINTKICYAAWESAQQGGQWISLSALKS